ncbi:leucine-rich_repeat domain-containing protein [Hexamita inflata]|uniref:Leucine-rich_repeat domain-containing protein n=1 Tax=Hexamita inflata TaxID=28002 RepID=A0ABP1K379_9EUKA
MTNTQQQVDASNYDNQMIQKYAPLVKSDKLIIYISPQLYSVKFVEHLKISHLELCACRRFSLTSQLPTNVTGFTLDQCGVKSLRGIKNMKQLTLLEFHNNPISDLTDIKDLTNLATLQIKEGQLKDISPIKHLINLKDLNLDNNQISDINPLKYLKNLNSLNLNNNKIIDISALKHLINLTNLTLYENKIVHINGIQRLIKLEYLGLTGNPILDLTIAWDLPNYNEFYLEDLIDPTDSEITISLNIIFINNIQEIISNNLLLKLKQQMKANHINEVITKQFTRATKLQTEFIQTVSTLFERINVQNDQ